MWDRLPPDVKHDKVDWKQVLFLLLGAVCASAIAVGVFYLIVYLRENP